MASNCPGSGYRIGVATGLRVGSTAGCWVKVAQVGRYKKLQKRLQHHLYSQLYRDSERTTKNSMMVAGTARSGTTWLGSLIASQVPCRMMFEPFQAEKVAEFRRFHYFHYMRPTEPNPELQAYCQKILSGAIRHPWVDREVEQLRPRYRVIKEIRANLFLRWISLTFPNIPLLFIIRHPCAVVASRLQLEWATNRDIEPFLAQPKLVEDFLQDNLAIIHQAETAAEKHAIIWSISNLVPLKQFGQDHLNVIFYENLVLQPEIEIPKLFQAINLPYDDTIFAQVEKPSTTTLHSSAVVTGDDKLARWQNELSSKQIRDILAIVAAFGLDDLYGESVKPCSSTPLSF